MNNLPNELYGFRCKCGERDYSNFYFRPVTRKLECLTCKTEYTKTRKGYYEQVKNATT